MILRNIKRKMGKKEASSPEPSTFLLQEQSYIEIAFASIESQVYEQPF